MLEQIGRHEHDGQLGRRPQLAQQGGGLPAVQVVHGDIEQHQVGRCLAHDLDAFAPAGGLAHLKTQGHQQAGQQLALQGLVVHHQQRAPGRQVAYYGAQCCAAGRGPGRVYRNAGQVQPHGKSAALAGGAG
ncbi:hypothetical protein D3C71_1454160 [compost metagenome]